MKGESTLSPSIRYHRTHLSGHYPPKTIYVFRSRLDDVVTLDVWPTCGASDWRENITPCHPYSYCRRAGSSIPLPFLDSEHTAPNLQRIQRKRIPLIRRIAAFPHRPQGRFRGCVGGAWRGEPGAPSTCGIHVSVGRTRKYIGKDTWSPVNRAQRGYPPRETARFTARLRRDPTSSLTEIVSSFYSPDRAQVPSLTNAPISRRTRARIFANRRISSRPP